MLTIENIRNDDRKSGFDHVNVMRHSPTNVRYRGQAYYPATDKAKAISAANHAWYGPSRKTPEEAAQDYCDYINGGGVRPPQRVRSAGHKAKRAPIERDAELEAALGLLRDVKAQRQGRQGYVYLIGVEGDDWGVKVGYSVNPEARVGELQTGSPRLLRLLAKVEGTTAEERVLHDRYLCDNLVGEWFRPTPELLSEFDLTEHEYGAALGIYERITA